MFCFEMCFSRFDVANVFSYDFFHFLDFGVSTNIRIFFGAFRSFRIN